MMESNGVVTWLVLMTILRLIITDTKGPLPMPPVLTLASGLRRVWWSADALRPLLEALAMVSP